MSKPAKAKKEQVPHRFKKGQSGNPKGRALGSRNKVSVAMDKLLDGQSEAIMQKAIDLALEGDGPALRLCMDRLCPSRKDRPISLKMPVIKSSEDVLLASGAVVEAVATGEITPSEGQALAGVIEAYRRTIETEEHERRLTDLERKQGLRK